MSSDLDGPVNFLAGFNYTEATSSSLYDVYWTTAEAAALSPLLGPRLYPSHYRNQTDPYELERKGLYTQVYYDASDDVRITVGARWNESEKSVADRQNLVNSIILAGGTRVGDPVTLGVQTVDPALGLVLTGQGAPTLPLIPGLGQQRKALGVPTSFTEEEVTGKVGVDWTPDLEGTDSTLIYATFSRGYRPGAFNPPIDPTLFSNVPQTTDPEFIDAYEIGMKNVLLDNSLVANLTAFFYDYQGLQVSKIIARTSVNENIDAEMQGLEAEFFWSPYSIPGLDKHECPPYPPSHFRTWKRAPPHRPSNSTKVRDANIHTPSARAAEISRAVHGGHEKIGSVTCVSSSGPPEGSSSHVGSTTGGRHVAAGCSC